MSIRPASRPAGSSSGLSHYQRAVVLHRAWRFTRQAEAGPVRFVRNFLRPGHVAFDVGANKGAYTFWMCRRAGRAGRVVAFEPQPEWAEYLRRIGKSFRFPQLTVIEAGLSSAGGTRTLVRPASNPSGGASFELSTTDAGDTVQVGTERLDDVVARLGIDRLHLIKVDVEGHEFDVFEGGAATLTRDRPALVFECQDFRHPDGQIGRVFALLEALGYAGGWFDERHAIRPVAEFEPQHHQRRGMRPFHDNFIFLPAEAAPTVIPGTR